MKDQMITEEYQQKRMEREEQGLQEPEVPFALPTTRVILLKKLHKIQTQVDSFVKDKKGHNYSYTTGDTVLNKIRPLMNEMNLLLKQEVLSVKHERIDYRVGSGDYEKDKSEMFTSVKQRFTWIDVETGCTEECLWHGNGQNDWDKGFGSALTYAERYFLLKFFHVPTDEDDPDARQTPQSNNPEKNWLNATDKSGKLNKTGEATARRLSSGKATWKDIHDSVKVSKKDKEAIENRVKEL